MFYLAIIITCFVFLELLLGPNLYLYVTSQIGSVLHVLIQSVICALLLWRFTPGSYRQIKWYIYSQWKPAFGQFNICHQLWHCFYCVMEFLQILLSAWDSLNSASEAMCVSTIALLDETIFFLNPCRWRKIMACPVTSVCNICVIH